jgi:peroxiredoxin Q/BCP
MPDTKLKIGDPAPDFALPSDSGDTVRLSDLRGKRVILYFYPADDTPGCTKQSCGFRDRYTAIEAQNAVVLGVSPDGVASHQKFRAKYDLPFPLLVDADHAVAEAYGAWGEKTSYGRTTVGLIRSHFVIDEEGRLADVRVKIGAEDSVEAAVAAIGG